MPGPSGAIRGADGSEPVDVRPSTTLRPLLRSPRRPEPWSEPWSEPRLLAHVERLAEEHPPLDLASCDFTVRDREEVVTRFAPVLGYMARAELEVERNVRELGVLLPHAPEVDRYFYEEVWRPQESHHGLALDELQVRLGLPPAATDLTTISPKIRTVGALAHLGALQDVVRMLYYLTGMTTERSALLAYHRLHDGLAELGETAVTATVIAPIRRQEPGHFAFYRLSAHGLWDRLAEWQRWLVRRLRAATFAPVAAGDDRRKADVGDMMVALGIGTPEESDAFVRTVARTEAELLGAAADGLAVPPYVLRSFRECLELATERTALAS